MQDSRSALTVPRFSARKVRQGGDALVMVTAYDYHAARLADRAGVDAILVGDSLGMVIQGRADTLGVTVGEVAYHVACVARARPAALVIADMPWLSFHLGPRETVRNAGRLVRRGAACVKVEGGRKRVAAISALLDAEIPVMGHLGLTPQSVHVLGGYRVQGRDTEAAERLVEDAHVLQEAGVFAVVLECVPGALAARVTAELDIPTIGIGAGPHCDGQVLVFHDLLGLTPEPLPRFVRRYADVGSQVENALRRFADDVRQGAFPVAAAAPDAGPRPLAAAASGDEA